MSKKELPDLKCHQCGSLNWSAKEVEFANGSKHIQAKCDDCMSHIRYLPSGEPMFHFGKYKGKRVKEVSDLSYLTWCVESCTSIKGTMKTAVQERLQELKDLQEWHG